jgi:hypothetical protein
VPRERGLLVEPTLLTRRINIRRSRVHHHGGGGHRRFTRSSELWEDMQKKGACQAGESKRATYQRSAAYTYRIALFVGCPFGHYIYRYIIRDRPVSHPPAKSAANCCL